MKKFIFSFVCLFSTVSLFAGKPVFVQSGDVSVLKEITTALLELDFSATTVDAKHIDEYLQSRGDDFVRDFPQDKEYAANMFANQFNKRNRKGMQVAVDVADAIYKFVIRVNILDYGNSAGFFVPFASAKAGGCIISGNIDIVDVRTDKVVLTLKVDEVKGLAHVSDRIRLSYVFFELSNGVAKIK